MRGQAPIPGMVRDRWSMDEHEGVLRVASGTAWGNGDVFLTTIDVTNPDSLLQLGQATLHVNENLTAARFDGTRGYLVTYRNIDPLFIFDLSDPRNPRQKGELAESARSGASCWSSPFTTWIALSGSSTATCTCMPKISSRRATYWSWSMSAW